MPTSCLPGIVAIRSANVLFQSSVAFDTCTEPTCAPTPAPAIRGEFGGGHRQFLAHFDLADANFAVKSLAIGFLSLTGFRYWRVSR